MKRGNAPGVLKLGSPRLEHIKNAAHEALAFARQATLLHRDVLAVYPPLAVPGDDVVVLLHGLFATAGVLRPMRRRIELDAPAHTASFSYSPGPGIETVAESLAELVAHLPAGVRVHLVGHSMGGVVARWYVDMMGGDQRVVQTISLASPFSGTARARLLPSKAGRDMLPGSDALARLRNQAPSPVPHLSVFADADTVVDPLGAPEYGECVVVTGCGHNGLLFHRAATDLVVDRVRLARQNSDSSSASRASVLPRRA